MDWLLSRVARPRACTSRAAILDSICADAQSNHSQSEHKFGWIFWLLQVSDSLQLSLISQHVVSHIQTFHSISSVHDTILVAYSTDTHLSCITAIDIAPAGAGRERHWIISESVRALASHMTGILAHVGAQVHRHICDIQALAHDVVLVAFDHLLILYQLHADRCQLDDQTLAPALRPHTDLSLGNSRFVAFGHECRDPDADAYYVDVTTDTGVQRLRVSDDYAALELELLWALPPAFKSVYFAAGPQRVCAVDYSAARAGTDARLMLAARPVLAQRAAVHRLGLQRRRDFAAAIPDTADVYFGEFEFDEWTGLGVVLLQGPRGNSPVVFHV
jgi:hypothetical protein